MGKLISTGEPSTLGTYLVIAGLFSDEAKAFIQKKIDDSPNGKDEVVIADEIQMLIMLASFGPKTDKKEI